jgi:hypothetical protein
MPKNLLVAGLLCAAAVVSQAQNLRVISAQYGHDNRWIDVAPVLNRSIVRGVLDFVPSNGFFGMDPAPAERKMLRIEYVVNGRNFREEYPENVRVVLPAGGAGMGGDPRDRDREFRDRDRRGGSLRIISARYGAGPRRSNDVTELLQRMVIDGAITVHVDNNSMRGDPAVGADKRLIVEYEYAGQPGRVDLREGDDLRLPGPGMNRGGAPAAGYAGIRILSASYGAQNRWVDVTRIVSGYVDPNTGGLRMRVSNDTMGGDPIRGPDKVLRVDYEFQGRTYHRDVREDSDLILP